MPTIKTDNFNALNNGDLNGQNNWTGDAGYDVETTTVKEGAKAVEMLVNDGVDRQITVLGTAQTDGRQTVYFRSSGTDVTGYTYILGIGSGSPSPGQAGACSIQQDGTSFDIWNGGGWTNIGTCVANTWHEVELEWRSSDHTFRGRIDGGAWSTWTAAGGWTTVDTVFFNKYNNPDSKYWDALQQDPISTATGQFMSLNSKIW